MYTNTFTTTGFVPNYEIEYWECDWDGCTDVAGNANYATDWTVTPSAPYTSIAKFISDKTFSASNDPEVGNANTIRFWVDEDTSYEGVFGANNTIKLYNSNWDGSTQTMDNSKLNVEGSYEFKTVDGMDILVFDVPSIVLEEWNIEDNAQIIYSVQDGALREGNYYYASSDEDGIDYNEVAARDIYALIDAQNASPSSALAPARSSTTEVVDTPRERSRQQWISKTAARNATKGL